MNAIRRRRRAGFSLIELMITVAIVGTLASVAVPSYRRMQYRSQSAEGRSNIASIRTIEEGYFVEFGSYVAALPTPAALPTDPVPWPGSVGFDTIGWAPEGVIRFQYAVVVNGGAGIPSNAFTAEGASDLDQDGTINLWGYVKQDPLNAGVPGALGCQASGVWDSFTLTPTLVETVGPCDATSGSSIF